MLPLLLLLVLLLLLLLLLMRLLVVLVLMLLLPPPLQATYLSFFPKRGRENLIIAVPSDDGNALTKENLMRALDLFQRISDLTVAYEVRAVRLSGPVMRAKQNDKFGDISRQRAAPIGASSRTSSTMPRPCPLYESLRSTVVTSRPTIVHFIPQSRSGRNHYCKNPAAFLSGVSSISPI